MAFPNWTYRDGAENEAAVAAESYRMSASLSASGNYEVVRDSRYGSETDSSVSGGKYVAEIHVDLEGREVARATAPFMGEQLAWEDNIVH